MCRTFVPRAPPFPASCLQALLSSIGVVASFPLSNLSPSPSSSPSPPPLSPPPSPPWRHKSCLPSTPGGIRCTNREPRADQWRLAAGWSSREQPPRLLLHLALPHHPSLPSLPIYPSACSFSPSFLPREKTRRVSLRRVDPIREGELFL